MAVPVPVREDESLSLQVLDASSIHASSILDASSLALWMWDLDSDQ